MRHPIRRQLLIPLLTSLVSTVLGIAVCAAWINMSRIMRELRLREDRVVSLVRDARFPLTHQILEQMSVLSGQQFLIWNNESQRFTESTLGSSINDINTEADALRAVMPGGPLPESIRLMNADYSARMAQLKWHPHETAVVLTSHSTLADARWTAISVPLAVGGGSIALLIPWLLALTNNWSRRISRIQQQVAIVAHGEELKPDGSLQRDDELSALMSDIIRMNCRLKELQSENLHMERERLMAQLAAGFAHQFRNGVAGISLALQLHKNRCSTSEDGSLSIAQKQLLLLEAEIRGILSLGRRKESPQHDVFVARLLTDALELVTPMIEHQQIQVEFQAGSKDARIVGSNDGLLAAILNLLMNAIDATGPKGRIRLWAEDGEDGDDGVLIVVSDRGPGPHPEIAERMVEPFETSKPDGVGLGLAIVAEVARAHQGRFCWQREEDWTMMKLWIPTRRVPEFEDQDGETRTGHR